MENEKDEVLDKQFERLKTLLEMQREILNQRDKMYPDHSAWRMFLESILFIKQISKEVTHRYRWLGVMWWIVLCNMILAILPCFR
jgi:hypothetical protein